MRRTMRIKKIRLIKRLILLGRLISAIKFMMLEYIYKHEMTILVASTAVTYHFFRVGSLKDDYRIFCFVIILDLIIKLMALSVSEYFYDEEDEED